MPGFMKYELLKQEFHDKLRTDLVALEKMFPKDTISEIYFAIEASPLAKSLFEQYTANKSPADIRKRIEGYVEVFGKFNIETEFKEKKPAYEFWSRHKNNLELLMAKIHHMETIEAEYEKIKAFVRKLVHRFTGHVPGERSIAGEALSYNFNFNDSALSVSTLLSLIGFTKTSTPGAAPCCFTFDPSRFATVLANIFVNENSDGKTLAALLDDRMYASNKSLLYNVFLSVPMESSILGPSSSSRAPEAKEEKRPAPHPALSSSSAASSSSSHATSTSSLSPAAALVALGTTRVQLGAAETKLVIASMSSQSAPVTTRTAT